MGGDSNDVSTLDNFSTLNQSIESIENETNGVNSSCSAYRNTTEQRNPQWRTNGQPPVDDRVQVVSIMWCLNQYFFY